MTPERPAEEVVLAAIKDKVQPAIRESLKIWQEVGRLGNGVLKTIIGGEAIYDTVVQLMTEASDPNSKTQIITRSDQCFLTVGKTHLEFIESEGKVWHLGLTAPNGIVVWPSTPEEVAKGNFWFKFFDSHMPERRDWKIEVSFVDGFLVGFTHRYTELESDENSYEAPVGLRGTLKSKKETIVQDRFARSYPDYFQRFDGSVNKDQGR